MLFSCSGDNASKGVPDSVANAPLVWVLEDVTGTVLLQASGDTFANPVTEGQAVHPGDEVITRDASEAVLTLDETTLFRLSEDGDVKVSQLAWNSSGGFVSRLELAAGRVLSEVEKLSDRGSTFEVESGGVICGVRGTSFEVAKTADGVEDSTFNGEVGVAAGGNTQSIGAGEHGGFSNGQNGFLPKRPCTPEEKAAYENWKSKLQYVRGKTRRRWDGLRKIDHMSPEQRRKFMEGNGERNGTEGRPQGPNPSGPGMGNGGPSPQGRAEQAPPPGRHPEGGGREGGQQAPHAPPPREHR
jgi:hypothetical protein